MERSGGDRIKIAAKRPNPSEDGEGGQVAAQRRKPSEDGEDGQMDANLAKRPEDGEDRLSALPDDMLLEILLRVESTKQAVRTSVLASRWRNLWRCLSEVRLDPAPDGKIIRGLLRDAPDGPKAPHLRFLSVDNRGASPDSVTDWLPAAARRLVGVLVYNHVPSEKGGDDDEEDEASIGILLPCFELATKIDINIGFVRLALPTHGVFASLSEISLFMVHFHGPCDVGSAVSTPRCPSLWRLHIHLCRGLQNLTIESHSLLKIELFGLHCLGQLKIKSPSLQKLVIERCFTDHPRDLIADISASQLNCLSWLDAKDPRFLRLRDLEQLQQLKIKLIAYGNPFHQAFNQGCLRLLHCFRTLQCLMIHLIHQPTSSQYSFLLGDLVLPQLKVLQLSLNSSGHSFGRTIFHLLRCTDGLQRLSLEFIATLDFKSGYAHEQSDCWKTESLLLKNLEDIHIIMHGDEREVDFVQWLFHWAKTLKNMRITLKNMMSETRAKQIDEAVKAFSSPEIHIYFETSIDQCSGSSSYRQPSAGSSTA